MQREIKNIEDLRLEQIEAFKILREDASKIAQCKELGSLSHKIMKSVKLQIDYANARKEQPDIPFLHTPGK